MTLIYTLLVAHFVADFICQSDWMAGNKSKRWDALAAHVAVYIAVVGLIVSFVLPPSAYPYDSLVLFGVWIAVNAAAHFVQDAITSRINARLWFFDMAMPVMWPSRRNPGGPTVPHFAPGVVGDRHWFFVGIGADQLLHYVTLFVTAEWWLR